MPTFVFKGRNRIGETIAGERVADSRDVLRQLLRREQVMLTHAKEKGREIAIPKLKGRRKKVSAKELAIFTRQFSVMIDAGLPLVQCLEILAEQQDNQYFKETLMGVRQEVEEGATLAQAMGKYPKAFDQLYVNMVEAGETGGILDIIFQRLSTYIEKDRQTQARRDVGDDLPCGSRHHGGRRRLCDYDRRHPAIRDDLSRTARTRRTTAAPDTHRCRHQ
jgi:type IV pilus assembly protein PilC